MTTSRRTFLALAGAALPLAAQRRFSEPLGLQIYSLRREAARDLPGTLALVQKWGFKELEAGNFFGRAADDFRKMAAEYGLKVTSVGAEWPELSKTTSEAIDRAHTVGAEYVCCTNIPHARHTFTMDDVSRATDNFNRWGEALAGAGLKFCYHPHGFEFGPGPDGTLFDTMAKRLDPRHGNFEMDVCWFVFGNADPTKMLDRYPGRFPLTHIKDLRKGEPHTGDPGPVSEEASVVLGTGEVDWVSVLRAAAKSGVKKYYLEEEHPDAVHHIPQSLEYLHNLSL